MIEVERRAFDWLRLRVEDVGGPEAIVYIRSDYGTQNDGIRLYTMPTNLCVALVKENPGCRLDKQKRKVSPEF